MGIRDRKKIIFITILALTVFLTLGTVSAAQDVEGSSNNIADSSIYENSYDDINSGYPSNSVNNSGSSLSPNTSIVPDPIISGNVTHCTNGSSFPGVTVVVNSLNGTEVARTNTDSNGFYQIAFLSNDRTFYVSASYPGHMTVTKQITVNLGDNPNDPNFYGFANFILGPIPNLNIASPTDQFLNESFSFSLNFNNTGNETGFGPMVELILPPQIQYQSATFLGITLNPWVGVFGPSGILTNPFTGLTVTGTPGYTLYVFQQPLGSFTPGQPIATIDVNALLLGNSTLGVPLNITGTPVFRFGANETGTTPIVGNSTTVQVTPTVIRLTKTSSAPEAETATGENYKRTYTLTVDVANGQTVNNIYVTDVIPGNLQYVSSIIPSGATRTLEPSTTTPGGILQFFFSSITGIIGPDKTINYVVYAPRFDNLSQPVLNNITGSSATATNRANVTGNYSNINVSSNANYTLTLKSLAIQKSVTDITGGPNSPKPTDILQWGLQFQISDYFAFKNLVLYDTLGDGQLFYNQTGYTPTLQIQLQGLTLPTLYVNTNNPLEFFISYNSLTGITQLNFNVSQILIDNGYTGGTGILYGGNNTTGYYGPTMGTLTFWSQIQPYYMGVNPGIPHPIVSNDRIVNDVEARAQLLNNNPVSDSSSNGVTIVAPSAMKYIIKINGNDPVGPPYVVQPGDNITFSLQIYVPTSSLHQFYLMDYLPIPIFRATQFTTGQAQNTTLTIPAAGQWRLALNDTLSSFTGVVPSLVVDASQNVLRFNYGNISNSTQPYSLVNILFTVTATGDSMADGLYLTNLLNVNYENSPGNMFTDNKVVWVQTGEPVLNINKTATPTTNLQAGDVVTYTILIHNTGHAPAYNVVVTDNLLSANPGYIASISSIAASYVNGTAITGLNFMDLFSTNGLNFTALYPIFAVNGTNSTINITYSAILNSTVYPRQFINNTANITKYTSLPLPESPNFVRDPISSSASVQTRDVNFTKTYISSLDGVSSTPNLTIGETGLFRLAVTLPAGKISDLTIRDSLPAGLSYVSYALDLTGYSGTMAPISFTNVGNILNFTFTGATNTTTNSTFYINLTVRANNNTPYPGLTNVTAQNNATMDWNNPGHTPINRNASVNIIQPLLNVTKTFTPSTVQGGQLVNVRIRVTNTGSATAQHVIITDPLNGSSSIFDLSSVVSYNQNGFIFTYPANTVTFTGGNINPGQTLDFFFNITTLNTPFIGPTYLNIANATYWSLPWNGSSPNTNSRNYTNTGSATLLTGDPTVNKTIFNSSIHGATGNLTIGEVVTYRLRVTLPQGLLTNLQITDILPAGFSYIVNSYYVNTTGFAGTLGTLVVPPTVSGQNVIFLFNGTTNMSFSTNNTFYIELNATVLNQTGNQADQTKTNTMSLTWAENTHGPFTNSVNATIIEPNVRITKTASPTNVDGGDQVTITLTATNNGSSNAYQINITDILNTTLFDPATWAFTPVTGYTFTRNANIINIISDSTTFIAPGASQAFTFLVNVTGDVPSNSTFTNLASIIYSSMPPGFNETRNYTNSSGVVTFTTPTPSIGKFVDSTSEPDTTNSNVLIGEVVTYRLDLTIPEGKTLNVVLRDILPSNLQYIGGTAQIMRNNAGITSNIFDFTTFPVGSYGTILDSTLPQLTFNLGNITFTGTSGLHNGTISLRFNATVLNILANQNGTSIPNNASLNFTNSTGANRNITAAGPTLTVRVPQLFTSKTPNTTTAQGGQNITFTVVVRNNNNNNGAPAYNLQVLDPLNSDYQNLVILSIVPSSGAIVYNDFSTPNLLNITINQLNQTQNLTITYNVTVKQDVKFNTTMNNTVNFTGTSLPGDHGTNNATPGNPGTSNGKRTGQDGAAGLNNIFATTTATVTARSPTVSKSSTGTTHPVGQEVSYQIIINVPVGYTERLFVRDSFPTGMYYKAGSANITFTPSSGITVENNPPLLTGTNIIDFNLGWVNATVGGTITINYDGIVQNITSNRNGTNLTNNVTLFYANPRNPAQNITAGTANRTITIIEPNLNITKTAIPTVVDGGDDVQINFTANNNGSSPAYQIIITDNLDPNLFDSSFSFTPVSGYTFNRSVNTVTITADSTTSLAAGATQIFTIFLKVRPDVNTNSTYTNLASIRYSSMPPGFNETRNYTNTSNVVTFRTITPSISKSVNTTSEPDSTNPNVFIGEVVTYQLTFTVPEGKTDNVTIIDTLLSNLGYNSGTALIKRSDAGITATGFDFGSFVDQYISITPSSLTPLSFYLGNVTYTGGSGLKNGTITLIFNSTVLNIAGNQAGTQIPNNATLNFTNSTGGSRNVTGVCPTTLNVVVPQLSTTKTANPTVLTTSDTVTFTIQVRNNNNTNGAPAYDIHVIDPMNNYNLDYLNMIIVPSDPSIVFTNYSTLNMLNITINKLNQTQYLNITYNATVKSNVTFNTTINNTVNVTGTTLPGDHGTNNATPGNPGDTNGKRTGDPSQPAGAVNNIIATSTASVTTRSHRISKEVDGTKTVTHTIGETATESVNIFLPIGTTTELKIIDVLPAGLQASGFIYTTTAGVNVNQFIVTLLGGNTYEINFGNVTITQEGNLTINYTVLILDVPGNYNGQNLTNNATVYYRNSTGQTVNAGSDTATVAVVEPNLQITKTPSKTNLTIGEEFTYTLVVTHTASSTSDAYNLIITDTIPTGLTFVTGSQICPGWVFTQNGNLLTFTRPVLSLDAVISTILFNCTVNNDYLLAGQNITNAVNLNYTSISSGGRNYTTNNSTQIHVIGADLQVIKNGDAQVNAGEQVTYTITITNLGPDTAENVTMDDIFLAPWFTYLSTPQYSLNFGTWTAITSSPWSLSLGNMTSGSSNSIRIRATVIASAPAGILNNTANVTSNTTDPNPNNNNSTATTNVTQRSVLTLLKENNPSNIVIAGNNLTYILTLTNTGPSVARDVTITDDTFSSYYLSRLYSYSVNGGAWSVWTGFSGPLVINVTHTSIFPSGYMNVGDIFRVMINGTVNASTSNGTVLLNNATANSSTSPFNVTSNTVTNNVETSADLGVTKVGPNTVTAGTGITYVVVVRNSGPSDSQVVVLNDVVPSWIYGVTYTAVSNSHSEHDSSGNWLGALNWATVFFNEVITLTFTGTVNASTPNGTLLNNTVNVTALTPDPYLNNNTATKLTDVNTSADVGVTKAGPDSVTAGTGIIYVVVVTNNGPSDSQGVVLVDVIPSWVYGVTYTAVSNSHSEHDSSGNWWGALNWATVFFNEVITLTFTGTVNASTPNGTLLNNTVNVSALTPDPVLSNNTATKLTEVNTSADVGVTKVGPDSVTAGTGIIYVVVVTNNGPSDSQGVVLADVLPVWILNVTYGAVSSSYSGHNVAPGTVWSSPLNWATLFVNEVITLTFNGVVNASTPNGTLLNNTVNVSALTPDPVLSNNTATKLTEVNTSADVGVSKSGPDSVTAGTGIIYVVVVTNNGPSDSQGVVLADVLPVWINGVTYTAVSNSHSEHDSSGNWLGALNWATVFFNEVITLTFTGTVNASTPNGTLLNNTVNVSSLTPDPNLLNNNATKLTDVNTSADVGVTKSGPDSVTAGTGITYVVVVTNNGPSDSQNVILMDVMPSWIYGVTFGAVSSSYSGHDVAPGTVWSSPLSWVTLFANEVITLTFTGTVNASTPNGTVLNNSVNVSSLTSDPNLLNNNATKLTDVNTSADVGVSKSGPDSVTAGTGIIYVVVVTNNGPSDSQGVVLVDVIPSWVYGVTFGAVSSSYSGHDVAPGTVWSSPLSWVTLFANEVITLTFTGTVNASTPNGTLLNNTVNVTALTPDPVLSNNTATKLTDVNTSADVGVSKSGPDSVTAGTGIIYVVVVTNYGPSDSQGVVLADVLPVWILNVTYGAVSSSHSEHDVAPGTVWSSPLSWVTLFANEVITLTFTGTVNASTPNGTLLNNTVNVSALTPDPNPLNNNDTKITAVGTLASLNITKISVTEGSDVNNIVRGYPIHYTIVITNNGPSDALNVNFDDYYTPDLLENTDYSTSTGIPWTAYTNPLFITPIIDRLAPGQNVTVWINGTVISNATQGLNNTAGTSSETDPDGRKTAYAYNNIQTSHVTIEKTVSNPQPYLHEIIYFTLIVQNWGPDTAIDVYVDDKLPAGIVYISSTANYGSYNPATGIWTIGNLPANTIAQLVMTVGVEKLGPIENHAHVYTASWDPILGPRSATAAIYVREQPSPGENTVGMQKTGTPIPLLVMAILLVLSGIGLRRKR